MRQITIRFRLITPAYVGGANPHSDPAELRAPSIRGVLRYWMRAAAGAADPDPTHVRKIEDATFGSVDRGSPLSLWLSNESRPPQPFSFGAGPPVPVERPLSLEQRYLFWSMSRRTVRPNALSAGTEFDLHLALRGNAARADETFARATSALWLLAHLGGLGARSRRCAGSLSPLQISGSPSLPTAIVNLPFTSAISAEDLQQRLQSGISEARALFTTSEMPQPKPAPSLPAFDVLARGHCRLWILRPATGAWATPDLVLDALGGSLRDYRRDIPRLADRAVFGLPIIPRQGGVKIPDRRASPLLLRVSMVTPPTGAPEYLALAVLFKSQFMRAGNHSNPGSSNYQLIERWVSSQFPDAQALEVQL